MNIRGFITKTALSWAVYRNGERGSTPHVGLGRARALQIARELRDEASDPKAFFAVGGYSNEGNAPIYLHLCTEQEAVGSQEDPR